MNQGNYEQAGAFYMRYLEARERLVGPDHPDTLSTVANLAGLHKRKDGITSLSSTPKRRWPTAKP